MSIIFITSINTNRRELIHIVIFFSSSISLILLLLLLYWYCFINCFLFFLFQCQRTFSSDCSILDYFIYSDHYWFSFIIFFSWTFSCLSNFEPFLFFFSYQTQTKTCALNRFDVWSHQITLIVLSSSLGFFTFVVSLTVFINTVINISGGRSFFSRLSLSFFVFFSFSFIIGISITIIINGQYNHN